MPTVSIIMPAYNPGRFLRPAIESAIAQSFTDWELVIVDDGSRQAFRADVPAHPAIRYLRQENGGPAVARNTGINNSTGEFIAFLDADDLWLPDKLARQIDLMRSRPEIGLCHTKFDCIDAQGTVTAAGSGRQFSSYAELLKGCALLTSTTLLRRSCLAKSGLFDPVFRGPEDYDFFLSVAKHFPTQFIDELLVHYRVHPQSLSSPHGDMMHMFRATRSVLVKHATIAKKEGNQIALDAAQQGIAQLRLNHGCAQFDLARSHLHAHRPVQSGRCLWRALRLQPAYTARSIAAFFLPRLRAQAKSSAVRAAGN
jgi:glycosyltransferase involved in cell wall biosynthesis